MVLQQRCCPRDICEPWQVYKKLWMLFFHSITSCHWGLYLKTNGGGRGEGKKNPLKCHPDLISLKERLSSSDVSKTLSQLLKFHPRYSHFVFHPIIVRISGIWIFFKKSFSPWWLEEMCEFLCYSLLWWHTSGWDAQELIEWLLILCLWLCFCCLTLRNVTCTVKVLLPYTASDAN